MTKQKVVQEPILVEPEMKIDEKSFIKAKIAYWENDKARFQKEIQDAFNKEMGAYDLRIAQLTELLYERFPEEKPPEPDEPPKE